MQSCNFVYSLLHRKAQDVCLLGQWIRCSRQTVFALLQRIQAAREVCRGYTRRLFRGQIRVRKTVASDVHQVRRSADLPEPDQASPSNKTADRRRRKDVRLHLESHKDLQQQQQQSDELQLHAQRNDSDSEDC